jgi:hypothetical protein
MSAGVARDVGLANYADHTVAVVDDRETAYLVAGHLPHALLYGIIDVAGEYLVRHAIFYSLAANISATRDQPYRDVAVGYHADYSTVAFNDRNRPAIAISHHSSRMLDRVIRVRCDDIARHHIDCANLAERFMFAPVASMLTMPSPLGPFIAEPGGNLIARAVPPAAVFALAVALRSELIDPASLFAESAAIAVALIIASVKTIAVIVSPIVITSCHFDLLIKMFGIDCLMTSHSLC